MPELFGGAADLTSSTKTIFKPGENFHVDPAGRNVFFGVREFGMCAAVNGMAAHGGLIPFGSTFFVFSDYAKPAIRLAALMQVHSLFVFTHDSIGAGRGRADAPAHRAPDGAARGSGADGLPSGGRQRDGRGLAAGSGTQGAELLCAQPAGPAGASIRPRTTLYAGVSKGAYVLEDAANPQVVLIGTGSEVWPALEAAKLLAAEGIRRAGGQLPQLEDLRGADGGVQGQRAAGGRAQAGGRGRRYAGLVEVRGPGRRRDWAGPLWRLGAGAEW